MTRSRMEKLGPPCGLWSRILSFHLRTWRSMRAPARSIDEYMSSVVSRAWITMPVGQGDLELGHVVVVPLDREDGVGGDGIPVEVLADLLQPLLGVGLHGLGDIHVAERGGEVHPGVPPLFGSAGAGPVRGSNTVKTLVGACCSTGS